jgi:hypothetical protein
VQAVTIDQMPPELASQWHQAAGALIEAAIPDDTAQPEAWPVCAALLPHALAAVAEDSDGMNRLVNYLGWRGSYGAAVELQRRILVAYERSSGPEDPALLTARHELAFWTGEAGDAARARDQFAALRSSASGCSALSIRTPWQPGTTVPAGPGRPGMWSPPATSSPPCCR